MKRLSIILMALVCISCGRGRYVSFGGYAQGGTWSVKYNTRGATAKLPEVKDSVEAILSLVDSTFSGYNKKSMVSRYNAGEVIAPNDEFLELLEVSDRYKRISNGAFDIGAAPLFDVWGFGFSNDSLPSPERVQEAMEECKKGEKFNFNAIAQGYTCDLVARYLESIGVKDMLVDIGEIYCQGLNPSGKPWSIGIDTPVDGNDTPGSSLSGVWISDGGRHGIVTSGNYRKFYVKDGRKYAHTIDPRTGYPVEHGLLSATVVAEDATTADATATWFMVIGFDQAREVVERDSTLAACLITRDSVWFSENFKHRQ